MPSQQPPSQLAAMPPPERAVFCNRTLNMRSIRAVGFDMDYTLVHYDVHQWEARAYVYVQQRLLEFAQELKASIDLAHERISGVAEGLVRVGEVIGDPPTSNPPSN